MSEHGSESENPAIDAPEPKAAAGRGPTRTGGPTSWTSACCTSTRPTGNPLGEDFDYARSSRTLDVEALKRDVVEVMTTSQDWWPADFGHYGGLFIRLSWHAAGTYRIEDGRGGAGDGRQRFAPLNSWPDNANLDKARRLLWPVKQKYGQKISWADLLVLAGNVALEDMGFETFGFGFGREDVWEPEEIFWGPEDTWLGDERYSGDRELAEHARRGPDGPDLRQPRGPQRQPRPAGRGPRHPRDVPPDGDERRGDRRADRRRPLVRQDPRRRRPATTSGPEPEGCPLEAQGLGWQSTYGTGKGADAITSGLEVTWTSTPTQWGNGFFENLFGHEWELTKSPAGAHQWVAKDAEATIPDAHDPAKKHRPTMLTTDLALRVDPAYEKISRRFLENPDEFALAFAKAWYKLLHRDMGPVVALPRPLGRRSRSCGRTRSRRSTTSWSTTTDVAALKAKLLDSGLSVAQLASTAWASAASFREHRQARRRQRRPHPAGAAAQAGRSTSRPSWRRCCRRSSRSSRSSTPRSPAASRSRWPT